MQNACVTERDGRTSPFTAIYREGIYHCDATRIPNIVLRDRRELQLMDLRGDPRDIGFSKTVIHSLSCPLPIIPNTTAHGTYCDVLWLGPAEWLLSGIIDTAAIGSLEVAGAQLTDVSHGRAVVRVSGCAARDLLAKGCSLDLHPRSFQEGRCAQTNVAKINILLHYIEESIFDIYVGRSYALYFWEWLTISASEFGYEVAAPYIGPRYKGSHETTTLTHNEHLLAPFASDGSVAKTGTSATPSKK
jgi:sarcosine oxidase subunit gamma